MGIGKTNKRKGSNAERLYAIKFRDLGFNFCETSRFVSKKHDNAKIDLMYIPFNLQIKAGKQKNMNVGKELFAMYSCIQAMFPKEDEVFKKPLLLVHYEEVGRGHKRLPEHEKVYMSLQQFDIFQTKSPFLKYDTLKDFKFYMNSEFKTIVSMTFEVFKNEIILKHYIENGSNNNTTE
jgi:hypothetical protein